MKVGKKTLNESKTLLGALLDEWEEKINEAYLKADGTFTIDLKISIKPDDGGNNITASIAFVSDKVKDSAQGKVDEDQMEMFENNEGLS